MTKIKNQQELIQATINELWNSGIIQRGAGYCLSMSEIISTLLRQKGLGTRLVECKLTVMTQDPPGILMIGHDRLTAKQNTDPLHEMDVHVVCVTETDPPMLIDLSVHGVDVNMPYILQPLNSFSDRENSLLLDFKSGNVSWIYQSKPSSQLPILMQQSLIDRIKLDQQISKNIKIFKIIIAIVLVITSMNFLRGGYDFYQKYVNQSNNWGPNSQEDIQERLDRLEKSLGSLGSSSSRYK